MPAPRTLFKGVSKLPAASTLIAEEGARAAHRDLARSRPASPTADLSDDDLADLLAERFADAVERQMMSDVPYGAFLSGGVDSAAVVAAMAKRSPQPPSTFTIGFPGHGGLLDERGPAAESARLIGTDHHETAMVETDFLAELATAMPHLEEPCGIPSAPALAQLSRFAAEQVKVVLAGQGADEPHGGYGRHQAAALLNRLRLAPAALATPGRRRSPARSRAPPAPGAPPTCSAAAATPSACCAWSRSPTRRCASALLGQPRRRRRRTSGWRRRARCSATWRAATCSSRRSTSTRACSCPTAS